MKHYSKILSTGSYLPEKILTNADLEKMVDTTDEWIVQRVGVRRRHLVGDSGDTTVSMAEKAGRAAITVANIAANTIDLIIVATASPDQLFPSVACHIQKRLEITNECPAFDINAGCSGFIYAMNVADQYIRSGAAKNVLIVGADTLSAVTDWQDRATCILFGDGAGAVVLSVSDTPGILSTHIHANGQFTPLLFADNGLYTHKTHNYLQMQGNEVFRLAVTKLGEIVDQTLVKAKVDRADIDWLIPHQANMRIIQAMAKRLNLPMEKVITTIEEH